MRRWVVFAIGAAIVASTAGAWWAAQDRKRTPELETVSPPRRVVTNTSAGGPAPAAAVDREPTAAIDREPTVAADLEPAPAVDRAPAVSQAVAERAARERDRLDAIDSSMAAAGNVAADLRADIEHELSNPDATEEDRQVAQKALEMLERMERNHDATEDATEELLAESYERVDRIESGELAVPPDVTGTNE